MAEKTGIWANIIKMGKFSPHLPLPQKKILCESRQCPSSKTTMPLPTIPPLSLSSPCLEDLLVFKNYFLNSKATVRSEQFHRYGHLTPGQGGPGRGEGFVGREKVPRWRRLT